MINDKLHNSPSNPVMFILFMLMSFIFPPFMTIIIVVMYINITIMGLFLKSIINHMGNNIVLDTLFLSIFGTTVFTILLGNSIMPHQTDVKQMFNDGMFVLAVSFFISCLLIL